MLPDAEQAGVAVLHSAGSSIRRRVQLTLVLLLGVFLQLALAQQATVTGKIVNERGEPLSGASVQVKGSASGVSTNDQGVYTIPVPNLNASLVISYIGLSTQEIELKGRRSLDVKLTGGDANSLNDVVVVGYGRQKKVNLVGAVSAVNVDEKITSRALPNISSGLEGLVPGLAVTQNSGMAGSNGAALLIRGLGTVNNANPLVVVDGMPDIDINRINVNDIETISVLKDATSASVYGSRAANGVILITTKSGRGQKKTNITFNSTASIVEPTKAYDFLADYPRALTLEQRRALTNTLYSNLLFKNGTIDQWLALGMIDPLRYPNTDWWDILTRQGAFQNYNLSASGGDEKSNFFMSAGYKNEKGLQINNDYIQYNARFSYDYKLRSNMNAGVKFNGNWSKNTYALLEGFTDPTSTNTAGYDMQYAIAGITPYDPATGLFGGVMAYNEDPQAYNPYTVYTNNLNRQNRQEANGIAYLDWTPVKGLTGRVDYSVNYYNQFLYTANTPNQAYNFQTGAYGSRVYVGTNAAITNDTRTGYKTQMSGRLNYHTVINTNHDISALVVYSEEYWYDRIQYAARNDRLYPTLREVDAALVDASQVTGGSSSTEGLASYIGRLNYTAFNKYLFEANFRADGSSKFIKGSQYGFFPSVALGWRFTEEGFLSKFTDRFLNSGKLRASYGALGNNSGVGRFEQQPTLAANLYIVNGSIIRGFVNTKLINQSLTWENTKVFNVGTDLAFLNSRLNASIDYYDRLTTGMNRPSDLSLLISGAFNPAPRRNIGNMRNRGIEGDFSWRDKIGRLNYGVSINASYNTNKLEKWNEYLGRGTTFIGMPYNFVYTYQDRGIAQTWQDVYNATPQGAQPGDLLREDLNGDGRIDGNDMKAYANTNRTRPSTYFALNSYVAFKGFDLAFLLQGSAGRKDFWLNNFNQLNFSTTRYAVTQQHLDNPWSVENRNGLWPRLGGSGNNTAQTTFWLDDMSYLRFKNVQLGYTITSGFMKRAGLNSLRIVGTAENLFTFSSFRGLDPEKAGDANNLYPLNKSYSVAVNLGF
ncbi:MAG: TonB-dependent receptor [Williamsia sp.]|nr:TonB-dependent receptor [Williamsia sp.]